MLELRDLRAAYGGAEVLHGISLKIGSGEMVALLGANGAGKTTTLAAILRLTPPEGPRLLHGTLSIEGSSLLPLPTHRVVREKGVVLVPEGRHIFGNLSVEENLRLATYGRRDRDGVNRDMERTFALFPRLKERRHQRGDTLSGGEQQMLAMGRALMTRFRILLLDEPSMGLSPLLMQETFRVLSRLHESGSTLLVVEQNARVALRHATRGIVLEHGQITLEGPAGTLRDDPAIQKAYLGKVPPTQGSPPP